MTFEAIYNQRKFELFIIFFQKIMSLWIIFSDIQGVPQEKVSSGSLSLNFFSIL